MARAKSKRQVAKPKAPQLPAGWEDDSASGAGLEGTDQDSFAIPFLRILQSNSPQCEEAAGEYVKGAKPGLFINTVTNELFNEPVFLHCAFQRQFIRWSPRGAEGGGFKGVLTPDEASHAQQSGLVKLLEGRWYYPLGDGTVHEKKCDRLQDTRNHFGLVVREDGSAEQCLLSLTSTQIKQSKRIMAALAAVKIDGRTPPTWMSRLKLSTALESNDEGSWFGLRVMGDGFIETDELYAQGKGFHDIIRTGQGAVNYEQAAEAESDDIPF